MIFPWIDYQDSRPWSIRYFRNFKEMLKRKGEMMQVRGKIFLCQLWPLIRRLRHSILQSQWQYSRPTSDNKKPIPLCHAQLLLVFLCSHVQGFARSFSPSREHLGVRSTEFRLLPLSNVIRNWSDVARHWLDCGRVGSPILEALLMWKLRLRTVGVGEPPALKISWRLSRHYSHATQLNLLQARVTSL